MQLEIGLLVRAIRGNDGQRHLTTILKGQPINISGSSIRPHSHLDISHTSLSDMSELPDENLNPNGGQKRAGALLYPPKKRP